MVYSGYGDRETLGTHMKLSFSTKDPSPLQYLCTCRPPKVTQGRIRKLHWQNWWGPVSETLCLPRRASTSHKASHPGPGTKVNSDHDMQSPGTRSCQSGLCKEKFMSGWLPKWNTHKSKINEIELIFLWVRLTYIIFNPLVNISTFHFEQIIYFLPPTCIPNKTVRNIKTFFVL